MDPFPGDNLDRMIDDMLSSDIVVRIALAKADLGQRMTQAGLLSTDGWKIQEELRDTDTGTRWVFRAVRMQREATDLQSSITLDHDGRAT